MSFKMETDKMDNVEPDAYAIDRSHPDPSTTLTAKDNRRLLWKIDAVVLPIMTITATLAALDKVRQEQPPSLTLRN